MCVKNWILVTEHTMQLISCLYNYFSNRLKTDKKLLGNSYQSLQKLA